MRRAVRLPVPSVLAIAALWSGAVVPAFANEGSTVARTASEGPAREAASAVAGSVSRPETVVLGARALFATNAESLSPAGEVALERLSDELLSRHVAHDSIVAIRVVGYTDGVGAAAYNQRLSERRAAAVGAILARQHPGVPLVTEGQGESVPVASDASAAGRARNRRVEIHVVAVGERR